MSQSTIVLIILVIMSISFFAGYIPLAITALAVPLALELTGVLKASEAWAGFSNTSVVVLIPLFMLGGVLKKTTFLEWLKKSIVGAIGGDMGKSGKRILLLCMLASFILPTFLSPVAVMSILCPVLISIADEAKYSRKALLKSCADVACTGNNILPFGTALTTYMTYNAYLEAAGASERFNLIDPFACKIPIYVVYFLFIYFVGSKYWEKRDKVSEAKTPVQITSAADTSKRGSKKSTLSPFQNKLGIGLFFGAAAAMILASAFTNIPLYIVGFIFCIIAVATKIISEKELFDSVSWSTVFLLACTLPLSTAMTNSGCNDMISHLISLLIGDTRNAVVIAAVFFLAAFIITQFISNRAVGAVFRPIAIAAAVGLGVDPRFTLLAELYGSSLSTLTPMATPAEAIIYNEGKFKMGEFFIGSVAPCIVWFAAFLIWFPLSFKFLY